MPELNDAMPEASRPTSEAGRADTSHRDPVTLRMHIGGLDTSLRDKPVINVGGIGFQELKNILDSFPGTPLKFRGMDGERPARAKAGAYAQALLELLTEDPGLLSDPSVQALACHLQAPEGDAVTPFAAATVGAKAQDAPSAVGEESPKILRATWSTEAKKTKAEGRRNPAQFIREEYAEELAAGLLTRSMLPSIDFPLSQAFTKWVSPNRHPEDLAVFPPEEAEPMSEEERAARRRMQLVAGSARYRSRKMSLNR